MITTTKTDHTKYALPKQEGELHTTYDTKPTLISAEHCLCNQLNKHKKDPLNTILDHLEKHPPPSTIADTTTAERSHNHWTANNQTAPENAQNNHKKHTEEKTQI